MAARGSKQRIVRMMEAKEMDVSSERQQACPLCEQHKFVYLLEREYRSRTWRLARCLACGLHFTDPRPTLDDIKGFYAGTYHAELRSAGATEQIFGPKYERYIEKIRRFVVSGRTLDVGCATGLFPHMLQKLGYQAEGVELNPESLEWGRTNYRVPIHAGTMEELVDLCPASYDLITMTDVLEHTENPLAGLRCVNRLLKKNAHAMVTFPDIRSVKSRYYEWLARLTGRDWIWCMCHIPGHTWEFTEPTAVACFERTGFRVVDFHRSESAANITGRLSPLSIPARIFSLPLLAARYGSQMEFILRRTGDPPGPSN
jgi:2-polyprenyl-3-methyl-5-hydroxy-6-metoxy-1,4-benzoquinol methylase